MTESVSISIAACENARELPLCTRALFVYAARRRCLACLVARHLIRASRNVRFSRSDLLAGPESARAGDKRLTIFESGREDWDEILYSTDNKNPRVYL